MKELKEVIKRLQKKYRLHAILLFGSRARGDWGPWSDYDLLIIADFKEKYLDRIDDILKLLKDIRLPIEPHPYTLKEALEMLRKGNPTIVDALEEGILLFKGNGYKLLWETYNQLKKRGLRRTRTSIKLPN